MVHGTDTRPILLIDDDPDNREVMQLVLEHRGFQVITSCNGVDGLRVLEELGRPELILLDWMMPTMSGREFLEAIRERPELSDIPVIVVTAYAGSDPALPAQHLRKPFSPADLIRAVVGVAEGASR